MRRTPYGTCLSILAVASMAASGCKQSETVFVPSGEPMRLAEPVKARVATDDGHGHLIVSENRVTIPAGYWAIPDLGTDGEGPTDDGLEPTKEPTLP